jgi:hypothetical protein
MSDLGKEQIGGESRRLHLVVVAVGYLHQRCEAVRYLACCRGWWVKMSTDPTSQTVQAGVSDQSGPARFRGEGGY